MSADPGPPTGIAGGGAEPDRREIFGWQMYDWGWSAHTTTVGTALFGPYLLEIAEDGVDVFGAVIDPASFFSFSVSLAALIQVLALPLIGAVADHTDRKKDLLLWLAYGASAVTVALVVVTADTVLVGGALFIVAGIGFAAAGVVYNSFLPEIAPPEERDRVSSRGYALGYAGGGLWLAANFGLIALMDDTGLAVRLSLGGSGVWAALFIGLFTHRLLRARPASRPLPPDRPGWLRLGFRSVGGTLRDLRARHPVTLRYLLAYLLFNDGIETVIVISTVFAADELGAEPTTLLALVLLIQFVAVPGALGFGRLAGTLGAKRALILSLVVWAGLVIYAYLALETIAQLWMMGVVLALVLGGSQALARSLYSQMIPDDSEAEYFGFYEIASRGTSWIGPLVFGLVNQLTGSQRQAILSLIVFFLAGIAMLIPVDVRRGMRDAGQDPDRLAVL